MDTATDDGWARLQRIASDLAPTDAAWLLETYGPRCYRIKARDAAIRETAALHFPGPRCSSARALAAALIVAQTMDVPGDRHRDLRRILQLNAGRTLGWRQLADLI